ncbi:MAG: oligosaccharide flippase family protein [Pseudomonadota bacterium]
MYRRVFKTAPNTRKSQIDFILVIFGTAAGRAVAFLNAIFIARVLGPEAFGVFAFFFAVMMLTLIILSSFDTAYIRHAALVIHEREGRQYLSSNLIAKTAIGAFCLLCVLAVDASVPTLIFGKDYARRLLAAGVGAGIFLNFIMTQATLYRAKAKFHLFAIATNVHTVLVFIVTIGLWLALKQFTVEAVITGYMVSSITAGTVALIMIFMVSRPCLPAITLFWSFLSWGKWMFLLSFVVAVFDRVDFFFLTKYLHPGDIGVYAAGAQLISIIYLSTGALNNVFVPKAVVALSSRSDLNCYIKDSLTPILLVMAIAAMLIASAPYLINGFYGSQYAAAIPVVRIISFGWLGASVYLPFSFIFYALDEPHTRFYLELTKLILGGSLLSVLVPRYGMTGAALSIALALLINAIVSGLILWRKLIRKSLFGEAAETTGNLLPARSNRD